MGREFIRFIYRKLRKTVFYKFLVNIFLRIKKIFLKWEISSRNQIFIIVGASNTKYKHWVSTNKEELDLTSEKDLTFFFSKNKIDKILLEHVVEHLEYDDFVRFLTIVKKYLKKSASIRIAVPDANHPSEYVRQLTGVNGTEPGADDHRYFYNIDDFLEIAKRLNYQVIKLEHFDNLGFFHRNHYNFENGYISRCSKNYKGKFTENSSEYEKMLNTVPIHLRSQFSKYGISGTSLLVDFIN